MLFIHSLFAPFERPAFFIHFKGILPLLQKLLKVFSLHALQHVCTVLGEIASFITQSVHLLYHIKEGGEGNHLHIPVLHRRNLLIKALRIIRILAVDHRGGKLTPGGTFLSFQIFGIDLLD